MKSKWSRVGDIGVGICTAHSPSKGVVTTLVTGANTVPVNQRKAATKISIGVASCGHISVVITHSLTGRAEGQGAHRVNDTGLIVGGTYTMVTGSPNSFVGG